MILQYSIHIFNIWKRKSIQQILFNLQNKVISIIGCTTFSMSFLFSLIFLLIQFQIFSAISFHGTQHEVTAWDRRSVAFQMNCIHNHTHGTYIQMCPKFTAQRYIVGCKSVCWTIYKLTGCNQTIVLSKQLQIAEPCISREELSISSIWEVRYIEMFETVLLVFLLIVNWLVKCRWKRFCEKNETTGNYLPQKAEAIIVCVTLVERAGQAFPQPKSDSHPIKKEKFAKIEFSNYLS